MEAPSLALRLDDAALDQLADLLAARLADRLAERLPSNADDRWLTTKEAADYLGLTVSGLYKLTSARKIPFEQEGQGCRCWFKRSDLDAWRRS